MKKLISFATIAALSLGLSGQASAQSFHMVEKGETLGSISKEENISIKNIMEINNLKSSLIKVDQKLYLSSGKITENKKERMHIVKKGDTLFGIANKYKISLKELKVWNKISGNKIIPGQRLKLEKTGAKTTVAKPKVKIVSKKKATAKKENKIMKEITVKSTAYTATCKGCSGITATGINLKKNPNLKVISVDPKVIPLGSKVWVEGYGDAIAGDTGGRIKGNKIDVFIPNKQRAINWGNKTVKVKIYK
jgi:3D (Asp-Asp-Asp) domain-containing protein/LysM repeat protein